RPGELRAEHHIGIDAGSLDGVREPDHGRFSHRFMGDQGAFHFGRAETMTRNVDHVVDAPGYPVVAILIPAASVAGEIKPGESRKIRFLEAAMIAVHGAGLARPGGADAERSANAV